MILFSVQGHEYYACTMYDSSKGLPWCATDTDSNGDYIKDQWDYCSQSCGMPNDI